MKYAFTHCNVLDGTEKMSIQEAMTVIVEEGRITGINKNGAVPEGAVEIDVRGKYLLPGLINLHVHLPGSGKPKKAKKVSHIAELAERYHFLEKGLLELVKTSILTQLCSGVTTLRSLSEICHTDLKNRDKINSKEYIGPRILVAGYGVTGVKLSLRAGVDTIEHGSLMDEETIELYKKEIIANCKVWSIEIGVFKQIYWSAIIKVK